MAIKTKPTKDDLKPARLWEAKPKAGRRSIYGSASDLLMVAIEYFKWVEANPLIATEVSKYKGESNIVKVPKMRAMSKRGLCIFLGIASVTWDEWCKRDEYKEVCEHINSVIYEQKFTGAAADLLNAALIARELGMADKREITARHDYDSLSEEELDAQINALTNAREMKAIESAEEESEITIRVLK